MSDEQISEGPSAPEPPTEDPAKAQDAAEAVASLRSLFSTLVPPKTIKLQDALGNEYTARAMLPARSQIIVMQHLQRLWEHDVNIDALDGVAGVAGAIVKLSADPVILDGICAAFSSAHPRLVERAGETALKSGDFGDVDLGDPAELFPIEELVAGLIPFFLRFAARASDLMNQVTKPVALVAEA